MEADSKVAVEFLKQFHPEGPWVLTSIRPDRKAIETDTFFPADEAQAAQWLDKYSAERNIYFSVNPTIRPMSKKANREDIKAVTWLHVDVDPRAGEDISEERVRALGLLQSPPKGVPRPTCIVFSGGGYQGFWKLEEPILINGDLALAEDAKRYNRQLEILLGGDNCHNIDRIMRMPGTINIPDERKLKKGRTKTLTTLVEMNLDLVYPISTFIQAPPIQLPNEGIASKSERVEVSGNIDRLNGVEELDEWNVPDRVRVAIVQGSDTDNPKKGDNSRSAWLFDVCCQLARCQVPDTMIYSIITDPDFGISESVLAMGSNAEKYAIRQIGRAKDEVVDPWLRRLNERHAVIRNLGGKCRVIEELYDVTLRRFKLSKLAPIEFKNGYANQFVDVMKGDKVVKMAVGEWWFKHQQRRQYDSLVFFPGGEIPNAYNLWKGFSCDAEQGNCSLYLEHALNIVCSGDQKLYDYLIRWMARTVQEPASQGEVAVVLRGEEGTGKGVFVKLFGSLWGRHFLQVGDPRHLVGSFNAHLWDCVVLFADEAFYAGDKRHESVLKQLITEEMAPLELKGVDVDVMANYIHLILASNSDWVVPAGPTARRFFVLDVASSHRADISYFRALSEQFNSGGREALLHHLMNFDLKGFKVQDVPKTIGLLEQKLHSLDPIEEWWYQKLQDGQILSQHLGWSRSVVSDDLTEDYVEYVRSFNISRRGNQTRLGRYLTKICGNELQRVRKKVKVRQIVDGGYEIEVNQIRHVYEFPSLGDARAFWDALYGETPWPKAPEPEAQDEPEIPF